MPARIGALVAFLCGLYYLDVTVWRQLPALAAPGDFVHYYRAGQAILRGVSPFGDPEFLYPPLIAFLATPLALAGFTVARWIWFLLSQACLVSAAVLIWRAAGRNWMAAASVAVVWAWGGAAEESLALGQIGPLIALLLAISFTRESSWQGSAAAVGFCLKYIPGVLLPGFFLQRSKRALGSFAAATMLFLLLPWAVLTYAFPGAKTPVSGNYWMGTPALLSWSIPSALLRILDPPTDPKRLPPDWEFGNSGASLHLPLKARIFSLSAAALTLAAGSIALFLACQGRLSNGQLPWALAGLLSLGFAAAPVCWTHYQVMQYPGVALLLSRAVQFRQWWTASAVCLCGAMLYPLPVAILRSYYQAHAGWVGVSPAALYLWTSVTPLACLALFGLCLRTVRIK